MQQTSRQLFRVMSTIGSAHAAHQAASMALRVPAGCGIFAISLSESVYCCLCLAAQPLSLVSLSAQFLKPPLQVTPGILVCRDARRLAGTAMSPLIQSKMVRLQPSAPSSTH